MLVYVEQKMTVLFWRIAVILTMLLSTCACDCELYYVKPNVLPHTSECPGNPCHDVDYYLKYLYHHNYSDTVRLVFLEGHHRMKHNINLRLLNGANTFHFVGYELSNAGAIIDNFNCKIDILGIIIFENLTFQSASIFTSTERYKVVDIVIIKSVFTKSSLILTNTDLQINDSSFTNSSTTVFSLYFSVVTFYNNVKFHNNHGFQGGALLLVGTDMRIASGASLSFRENQAKETGGAIHVVSPDMKISVHGYSSKCFYQLVNYTNESYYHLSFVNNSARKGGDHIYGSSLRSLCFATEGCACLFSVEVVHSVFSFHPGYNESLSPVSADPTTVCSCDVDGQPQCDVLLRYIKAYPGSLFSLSVVVVGGDYGTTTGTVYASFNLYDTYHITATFGSPAQQHQVIVKNTECTQLRFSIHSLQPTELMFLYPREDPYRSAKDYFDYHYYGDQENDTYKLYSNEYYYYDYIDVYERNTPLFVNISLLPCPPGFSLTGDPPGCYCHPMLVANHVRCAINDLNGYHLWNSTYTRRLWVRTTDNTVSLGTHCPVRYCKPGEINVDLMDNPNAQCDFNRAGILCGSCKKNYSLAIGSSNCIYCPNNNNLALLIFFAAAGIVLVLIIAALNLTVTQGAINSLVFYANVLWAYQGILFPPSLGKGLIAHKTFIAWLNLDFGIETCFISGMNAYLKTWLQFIFPFYTASLFFIGVRYSSKLAKFLGSRSVPTLATLLFLSYSKLLRTIIACLHLSIYSTYRSDSSEQVSTSIVWTIDGNLPYGRYPHIFLLLVAIVCLICLWTPYTFLLLFMQWVRRFDHHGPLKIIARYKPFYDAYFAPLKDKHHYWFGVLLSVQGLLLLVTSLSSALPSLGIFLLLIVSIFLLCFVNRVRPYKSVHVDLLESSFLMNFIILSVGHLYFSSTNNDRGRVSLLSLSITLAFFEFCGIIIWNLVPQKVKKFKFKMTRNKEENVHVLDEYPGEEREHSVNYREISIANLISEEEMMTKKDSK